MAAPIEPWPFERPTTRDQPAAARDRSRDRRLVTLHCGGIDQRAHQRTRRERIADPHLAIGVAQAPLELRAPRVVDEDATRAGAALTGRADRAEHDGRHRQVEIGVLIDDDRVVSAKLEQPFRGAPPRACDFPPTAVDPVKGPVPRRSREAVASSAAIVNSWRCPPPVLPRTRVAEPSRHCAEGVWRGSDAHVARLRARNSSTPTLRRGS